MLLIRSISAHCRPNARTCLGSVHGATATPASTLAKSTHVYKGLDIVTAKASAKERATAMHHLVDILEPHQMFTVVDFRNRALKLIDTMMQKAKIPVIVGGTNYYIESIVWNVLVETEDDAEKLLWEREGNIRNKRKRTDEVDHDLHVKECESTSSLNVTEAFKSTKIELREIDDATRQQIRNYIENEYKFTKEELHAKLRLVDPVMAGRIHPNNRRKVVRAIEVWVNTGKRHSEVLAEQRATEGQLRKPGQTIILWLKCQQDIHDERLNARVDAMIEEGLIQELLDFHAKYNLHRLQEGQPPDYTKGVFQTLGFKEFHEYLMLTSEKRATEEGAKLLRTAIENMKMATRRYARRQNKMILARFLNHPTREVPYIYELDTSDLSEWDDNVTNKATNIIQSFLNKCDCQYEPLKPTLKEENKTVDGNSPNYCEICERILIGDNIYKIHLNSNKHKKVLKLKKQKESELKVK